MEGWIAFPPAFADGETFSNTAAIIDLGCEPKVNLPEGDDDRIGDLQRRAG